MKFILKIDLENDAMHTQHDVAAALRDVAESLGELDTSPFAFAVYSGKGKIRDINGNVVGYWEVKGSGDDDSK